MDTNEFFAPVRANTDSGNTASPAASDSAVGDSGQAAEAANTPSEQSAAKPAAAKAERLPVWVDLHAPTPDEIHEIEERFGIEIPTREEMQEIELSSRLYDEDGALFMTVSVLTKATTDAPQTTAVTFILVKKTLITVRYADPVPFKTFIRRVKRSPSLANSAEAVLFGLLEQIVDRLADLMEQTATDLEGLSNQVFISPDENSSDADHRETLRQIGRTGNLSGKAKDSLLNLHRLGLFLSTQARLKKDAKARLKILSRDIVSITEHANFIANKVTFLLDATLGMISLEQNNIIKIFSVAAAAFLPPTLIASIYGMNFEFMPELGWEFGYPVAIGLMVLSAVLPLLYFKRKGWL
ncbi:MAG: magnesium and cobalt transport protein CorA [Thalassospira sp.]|uniref:magnesium/cobalt transporter CorA n=1 Tax=unclassified Thalassospira TaxID=2648997 RepID=UPI000C37B1B1|nr:MULTISPECIES: magnesium/cobalt transporter CorA [unclassified Thalassospira]MBE72594.1 magnesium and cobalt transport protein CorA [Thalassospira sp.]QPO10958.1 magnesium/cobalt transporter CorA [Thalassospira sp. A40-3]